MPRIKDAGIEKIRRQFSKDRNEDKKILEYLACNKPVITTASGRSINTTGNHPYLIPEDG